MADFRRRYDVFVDVYVHLDGLLDAETAVRDWNQMGLPDTPLDDFIESQRKLLLELMGKEATLYRWVKSEIVDEVVNCGIEKFQIRVPEEELLGPVVANLSPPARRYFEGALGGEHMEARFDPFFRAFKPSVVAVAVAEKPDGFVKKLPLRLTGWYRVRITVDVTVFEIDPTHVREPHDEEPKHRWRGVAATVPVPERLAFLTELREAFLATEASLDVWLKEEALREIGDGGAGDVAVGRVDQDFILKPIIETLDPDARRYFAKALRKHALHEYSVTFQQALRKQIKVVWIAAAPAPAAAGD